MAWALRFPVLMRNEGHRVRMRLFSWMLPEQGVIERTLAGQGFEVSVAPFRDSQSNVRSLLEQVRKDPPDLMIANHVIPGCLSAAWLRAEGIPVVGVIRSDDEFYHGIIRRFCGGRERFRLSGVVCVSEFLRSEVAKVVPRGVPVWRIPSGTPVPERVLKPADRVFRITYLGRLAEEQKRILATTEAMVRVTREVEGLEAVLVGDGPERDAVEKIAARAGGKVAVLGDLSTEEVRKVLSETHAIILLSDYEGTPTAVMEGMAFGCVPVCMRIRSGVPELVEHGITGLLVDDRDDGFVAALQRLKSDPEDWRRMSDAARERIIADYSLAAVARGWGEVFRTLGKTGRRPELSPLPRRLSLARSHSGFSHQDERSPSWLARTAREALRLRFHAGRIRRSLASFLRAGRAD